MWSVLNAPDKSDGCNRFLIFGASKSGKTSVAFKLSYDVAAQGSTVLFVCRQSNIQNTFPSFISVVENFEENGHPPTTACLERSNNSFWSPIVLSRIQFKYVKNAAEMKRLFASLHMMHPPPQCIAVDDFTLVIDPLSAVSRQDTTFLELCQVLGAFIVDAVDYLDKEKEAASTPHTGPLQTSLKTKLIITSDCMDQSFMSSMLRYASNALVLHPTTEMQKSLMQTGLVNNGNTSCDGDDNEGSIKMTLRRKVALKGVGDEVIFSRIKLSNGKLLCYP